MKEDLVYNVWEFYVLPAREREFQQLNGDYGAWHEFFSRSTQFMGTKCLRGLETIVKDGKRARKYLTQDRWLSVEGAYKYIRENHEEFRRLSAENARLAVQKAHLGFFSGR